MPSAPVERVRIESLDQEGRGVARIDGKIVFVDDALPGETVQIAFTRRRQTFDLARATAIERASPARETPRCPHFGVCGGCLLQHMDPAAQVAAKQRTLEDAFWHIARLRPQRMLAPIHGPAWGYRQRARLGVRYVPRKGGVLVGFHERRSSYIADMRSCAILPERISRLLVPLRELVGGLSIRDRVPQIEVAAGDRIDVLVVRHLLPFTPDDEAMLRAFADRHGVHIHLQPGGPDTAHPFHAPRPALAPTSEGPDAGLPVAHETAGDKAAVDEPPGDDPVLDYALPDFDLRFRFRPTEFTQVNAAINRSLVRLAVGLLAPREGDRVADLFCGLGNFSLAIARSGASVIGVEGSDALVERARDNARRNGLDRRCEFRVADLFASDPGSMAALGPIDRMLIDPPREGALAVVRSLASQALRRIVYVSCNPATLARDAAVLVHDKGHVLRSAGVINMFPHTAHVESIAVFEPGSDVPAASAT